MRFSTEDLPYHQFKKLGLAKSDVLGMNGKSFSNLLKGKPTSLLPIKINGNEAIQAKISVTRHEDSSLSLIIHPIKEKIINTFGLSDKQITSLGKGNLVVTPFTSQNGKTENHIFQLDLDTKEIYKVRQSALKIPSHLIGFPVSDNQKESLKSGKPVVLENDNNTLSLRIDLISASGYKVKNDQINIQKPIANNSNLLTNNHKIYKGNDDEARSLLERAKKKGSPLFLRDSPNSSEQKKVILSEIGSVYTTLKLADGETLSLSNKDVLSSVFLGKGVDAKALESFKQEIKTINTGKIHGIRL